MGHYITAISAKYDRAKKHVNEFYAAIESFGRDNPNPVLPDLNGETGYITYRVAKVPNIPPHIPIILGDAIHNLRSTLDYIAHGLVTASGGVIPKKYASFPIFDSAAFYSQTVASKVPGLRQPCMDKLDRLQPYKGGWGHILWQLHQLDVRDKHRLLLTMCLRPVARTLTPSEIRSRPHRPTIGIFRDVFSSNPGYVAMKEGEELFTVHASEADEDVRFVFDVAINEPEVVEGEVAMLFLARASSEVYNVFIGLGPCL